MQHGLFWITQEMDFADILNGNLEHPEVYQKQLAAWIFSPAQKLSSKKDGTDSGIALLSLLLMVFEPHGQYLTGEESNGQSKIKFREGFRSFTNSSQARKKIQTHISDETIDELYKWARCGLMHSLTMDTRLLIDTRRTGQILSKHPSWDFWLIDPWEMLPSLQDYIGSYVARLKQQPSSVSRQKFNKTFERLVIEPGKRFAKLLES